MAQSLIATLTNNLGKTPDEIVEALLSSGWTQCRYMTIERWRQLQRHRYLTIARPGTYTAWTVVGQSYRPSLWETAADVRQDLNRYWMIPTTEFKEGNFPNVTD